MKHIKLAHPAYVGGVLRHPGDGVLPVEDEAEFNRLTGEEGAEDVTADFKAKSTPKTPAK